MDPWSWLKRRTGPTPPAPAAEEFDLFARCTELVQAGRTLEAESLADRAVRRAPAGSHRRADALNTLGNVRLAIGQVHTAVSALREACEGPLPTDREERKERLTYLSNLALALRRADRLDEAEEASRRGLALREDHYGRDHAGYAFGLEPLADLLLARGRLEEAGTAAEETVSNLWKNGHARIAGALALRAAVRARLGIEPLWEDMEGLPVELLEQTAREAIDRSAHADGSYDAALESLADVLERTLGPAHSLVTQVLAARANAEARRNQSGCSDARLAVIRRALALHEGHDRPQEALLTVQGLAMALGQRGDVAGADAAYRDAAARAQRLGSGPALSQVRRNHGLFLAEVGRRAEAESALRLAVEDADRAGDAHMGGRARVALALFLQHGGAFDEATTVLERGLAALDPAHPDALCGRSHLGALQSGTGCGCGDMQAALSTAFADFVRERLPDHDFVEHLGLELGEKGLNVEVRLRRAASDEEVRELQRVIDHALHEFRRRVKARD